MVTPETAVVPPSPTVITPSFVVVLQPLWRMVDFPEPIKDTLDLVISIPFSVTQSAPAPIEKVPSSKRTVPPPAGRAAMASSICSSSPVPSAT